MRKKVMTIKKKRLWQKQQIFFFSNFITKPVTYCHTTVNQLPIQPSTYYHSTLNLLPFNPQPSFHSLLLSPRFLFHLPTPFYPLSTPQSPLSTAPSTIHSPFSPSPLTSHYSPLFYCTLHFPLPSPHSPLSSTPSKCPWTITTSLPRPEPWLCECCPSLALHDICQESLDS